MRGQGRLVKLQWRRGTESQRAGYLDDEVERVRMLIGQIEAAGKDQTAIKEA